MNLNKFQELSKRTLNHKSPFPKYDNYVLGLFGEGGEFTDILKKAKYHGHGLDLPSKKREGVTIRQELSEEIGDAFWYTAAIASDINIDLEEVFALCARFRKERSFGEICRLYFYHAVQVDHYREHMIEINSPLECEIDRACLVFHLANIVGCLFDLLINIKSDFGQCLEFNVAKLQKRYPDKFKHDDSINRTF